MIEEKLTYKNAGVDVEGGYEAVKLMKSHIGKTLTNGVLSDIGGFGGLFAIDKDSYDQPVLVSGTDGVGTKLKIAFMMDKHNTIGEDCVAMCVNDILCSGAKPLFFLDYIATGSLVPEKAAAIVEGISKGCIKAGAALIGGETAEMPGLYKDGEYDVAGFAVGIVDRNKIIDGSSISHGDILVGLPSSGLHSNGFSLVRKLLFDINGFKVDQYIGYLGATLGEELIKPTRIYVDIAQRLIEKFNVKSISHITGGGFYENIPRMLPKGYGAIIETKDIKRPPIFDFIKDLGNIELREMYSTFNMGIGLVMAFDKNDVDNVLKYLADRKEEAYIIGEIVKGQEGIKLCHQ